MTYKKRGGLHFLRIGRLSFTWAWASAPRYKRQALHRELSQGSLVLPL